MCLLEPPDQLQRYRQLRMRQGRADGIATRQRPIRDSAGRPHGATDGRQARVDITFQEQAPAQHTLGEDLLFDGAGPQGCGAGLGRAKLGLVGALQVQQHCGHVAKGIGPPAFG